MTDGEKTNILKKPTITVKQVAEVLEISLASAYKRTRSGDISTIRIGKVIRVPTAPLRTMLGIP
jgi:excisionase family DNA binding protein